MNPVTVSIDALIKKYEGYVAAMKKFDVSNFSDKDKLALSIRIGDNEEMIADLNLLKKRAQHLIAVK